MTSATDIERERRFWDEQGWDYAVMMAGDDDPYVEIFNTRGYAVWVGLHSHFVEMIESRKAERYAEATRAIVRGD